MDSQEHINAKFEFALKFLKTRGYDKDKMDQNSKNYFTMETVVFDPECTLEVLQILFKDGADGKYLDRLNKNLLMIYVCMNYDPTIETIQFLILNGSAIDHICKQGRSVLHHAVKNVDCKLDILKILHEMGACR